MASAWGDSWGSSWGNSWGSIAVVVLPITGGGPSGAGFKRVHQFPELIRGLEKRVKALRRKKKQEAVETIAAAQEAIQAAYLPAYVGVDLDRLEDAMNFALATKRQGEMMVELARLREEAARVQEELARIDEEEAIILLMA